eukprot:7565495-Pyramimonas_sp.AAC.1
MDGCRRPSPPPPPTPPPPPPPPQVFLLAVALQSAWHKRASAARDSASMRQCRHDTVTKGVCAAVSAQRVFWEQAL